MKNKHSESYRYNIVDLSKVSRSRSDSDDIITFQKNFWNNLLGFKPEKEFNLDFRGDTCPNCNSNNIVATKSPAWTCKYYCNNCNYHIYIVVSDRMGGNYTDSIAIDKKESIKFLEDK